MQVLSLDRFKKILINKWIKELNEKDNLRIERYKITNLKYKAVDNRRKLNSIWHQTNLGVLPINQFLFKINKSKTDKCVFCDEIESVNHFVEKCKAYDKIWNNNNLKRKRITLGEVLDPDTPPPVKKKIATVLLKCFEKRKTKPRKGKHCKLIL